MHPDPFVQWFRQAGPYINAHHGKTFVVLLGGEAVEADSFSSLIHDLALLLLPGRDDADVRFRS